MSFDYKFCESIIPVLFKLWLQHTSTSTAVGAK